MTGKVKPNFVTRWQNEVFHRATVFNQLAVLLNAPVRCGEIGVFTSALLQSLAGLWVIACRQHLGGRIRKKKKLNSQACSLSWHSRQRKRPTDLWHGTYSLFLPLQSSSFICFGVFVKENTAHTGTHMLSPLLLSTCRITKPSPHPFGVRQSGLL